jgi:carboxylesterase
VSRPRPSTSYAQALGRFDSLRTRDTAAINPVCRTELLSHGSRTGCAVIILHGLTNCPQQFRRFGELCFAHGDNVLIARLPGHGDADRRGRSLAHLTAHELARFTDEVVDIGQGLGERVVLVGLSAGANAAAWAAQNRADVDRALVIAPLFGYPPVPRALTPALTNLWLLLPDRFWWWDDQARERLAGPHYCYFGFHTHAVAEMLRLAFAIVAQAARHRPTAHSIVIVTNADDRTVDNRRVDELAAALRRGGGERVERYEFAAGLGLGHDLIDPEQPYQRIEIVYPVLLRLMELPAR